MLKKHPPSRDVNDDDSFSFNSDFSAPMQKIKISTVASATRIENTEERRETQDRIDEERKHQTDVRRFIVYFVSCVELTGSFDRRASCAL